MKIVLWILLIVAIILLYVLFSKVKIHIRFSHGNDNDHFQIKIKAFFGLLTKDITVPIVEVSKKEPAVVIKQETESNTNSDEKKKRITFHDVINSFQNTREFIQHIQNAYPILRNFLKKVVILKFEWQSAIGTKDAALTANLTGLAWGIKGIVQAIVIHYTSVQCRPFFHVTPHFNRNLSVTRLDSILTFRIGYAILTAIKLVRHWKNGKMHIKASSYRKKNTTFRS